MPQISVQATRYPDAAAQILADRVSQNMVTFVKRHVLPSMSLGKSLIWRDLFVLSQILRYPDGLTPADISSNTRLDPATVLRANETLHKERYITILEQARDARSNLVQITEKGIGLLHSLFDTYLEKQDQVVPRLLPKLTSEELREIFKTCLDLQERAERMASLLKTGRIQRPDRTHYSRIALQESFADFERFPEFILQVYCRRASIDLTKFLKSQTILKMSYKSLHRARELKTLMCIDHLDGNATSMDVSKIMGFDPATTTRAVSILSNEGFIQASSNFNSDDRKKPLALSEKGKLAADEHKTLLIDSLEFTENALGHDINQTQLRKRLGVLYLLNDRSNVFASIKPGKLTK